jgi:hypothetical protein
MASLLTQTDHTENRRKKAQNAQNQALFFVTSALFCGQILVSTK